MKQNTWEALIVLCIKWIGMVKIIQKDFIDAVPIIPCHIHWDNELDLRRRESPDSPEFTRYNRSIGKDPGQTESILI